MLILNMDNVEFVKSLENVGMNGLLIVLMFGLYKFLVSRNFISKCGFITVDFRSKQIREKELEYTHLQKMAELENERLKYSPNVYVDNLNENKSPPEQTPEGCGV